MTITDRTIQETEFAYQHQFPDYEKQMIRGIVEKVAWEAWRKIGSENILCFDERHESRLFNDYFNEETEEK